MRAKTKYLCYVAVVAFWIIATSGFPGIKNSSGFTYLVDLECTPVKSQGSTGTCWSFATTSFLESELLRMGKGEVDLSEMFFVGNAYRNKAIQYFLYHGNNNFSQGGQAHDVIDIVREYGVVPDTVFPGIKTEGRFQHHELESQLSEIVKTANQQKNNFDALDVGMLNPVLKRKLGKIPEKFEYEGQKYTPASFRDSLGINPDDYVELTSFSHHPFYMQFILEIPDNWSHALYYNLPIDELMQVISYSLEQGFSVCWDGDTSEKSFSHKNGRTDLPGDEIGDVNQEKRQQAFLDRKTTDDHLMHITGISNDNSGRIFFKTKNSWGENSNSQGGFLYMSEDYVKLKTVAILVNRQAIPSEISKKLKL